MEILGFIALLYLSGFIIKFFLALGTCHVAAGVQKRLYDREGVFAPVIVWYVMHLLFILFATFFLWPQALRREGIRGFLQSYTKRQTIRDVIETTRRIPLYQ